MSPAKKSSGGTAAKATKIAGITALSIAGVTSAALLFTILGGIATKNLGLLLNFLGAPAVLGIFLSVGLVALTGGALLVASKIISTKSKSRERANDAKKSQSEELESQGKDKEPSQEKETDRSQLKSNDQQEKKRSSGSDPEPPSPTKDGGQPLSPDSQTPSATLKDSDVKPNITPKKQK